MRVCIVSYHQRMYDERAYWKLAQSLCNEGFDVVRIAVAHPDDKQLKMARNITECAVRLPFFSKNAFINYALRVLTFQTRRRRLRKSVLMQPADVYWLLDFRCHYLARHIKRRYPQSRIIYDTIDPTVQQIIDNRPLPFANRLWAWRLSRSEKMALPFVDHIVCTEPRLLHRYRLLCPQKPQSVLYNYTSLNQDRILSNQQAVYDAIYCGLLSPNRGLWLMLDAVAYLKRTNRTVQLLLLGPIDQSCTKQQIEKRIVDLGIIQEVCLHKPVEYCELDEFYSVSAVGLLPFVDTPSNRQILPIKLYEYLNFGLPVLAPNFGQMGEIITRFNVGMSVSMADVAQFAEALWQLRQNIQQYRQRAFEAGTTHFRWQTQQNELLAIIRGE